MPCSSDHFVPILDELQARIDREAAAGNPQTPISENQRQSAPALSPVEGASKSGRGGRRLGAGAPKGNLNALKHGLRSKQGVYPARP